jgi:hypothetical protein
MFYPNQYSDHYELMEMFSKEDRNIPAVKLYNYDYDAIYAAAMERFAQPLPDGSPSMFSSRSPNSAHSRFAEVTAFEQEILGREVNLMPYMVWVNVMRMYGTEIMPPDYPVITVTFERSDQAIAAQIDVEIPFPVEIRSTRDPSMSCITLDGAVITGQDKFVTLPARLNRMGVIGSIMPGEFSYAPPLSFIERVYNDGTVVFEGSEQETLKDAVLRTRRRIRRGDRNTTARDYYEDILEKVGIKKATILPGVHIKTGSINNSLVTVVVYPGDTIEVIRSEVEARSHTTDQIDIQPAQIIPISGRIDVRVDAYVTPELGYDLAARAIVENINPPYGKWGDRNFSLSLVTALERVEGIVATPVVSLVHADTNVPLSDLEIRPWNLFSIQQSTQVNIVY